MKNKRSIFTPTTILLLAVVLAILGYYLQRLGETEQIVPESRMALIIIFAIFSMVIVLILMSRKLFLLEKQEKFLGVQERYMQHLQELVNVTRSQRHDFVNHLQVVYALLQTGKNEKAQKYIENLCQEVRISGEILRLDIPELAALLLVKMGVASLKNISFTIEVESGLGMLQINVLELTMVVGNLVDNAFEAVDALGADQRIVTLRIFETGSHFVFQTINPGYIDEKLRTRIFEPGVSTKPGDRGMGLASVSSTVVKNGGQIRLSSRKDSRIKFTVLFPKG